MILYTTWESGSGKNGFYQGFGKGLGVQEPINEIPTFTILQVYDSGRLRTFIILMCIELVIWMKWINRL